MGKRRLVTLLGLVVLVVLASAFRAGHRSHGRSSRPLTARSAVPRVSPMSMHMGMDMSPVSPISAVMAEDEVAIRMATFNILAPCYHRVRSAEGSAATTAGSGLEASTDSAAFMESTDPVAYMARNAKILDELERCDADIICLQVLVLNTTPRT